MLALANCLSMTRWAGPRRRTAIVLAPVKGKQAAARPLTAAARAGVRERSGRGASVYFRPASGGSNSGLRLRARVWRGRCHAGDVLCEVVGLALGVEFVEQL